jgi:hypothetical protein
MTEKAPRPGAPTEQNRAGDGRIPGQECRVPNNTLYPKILAAARTGPDLAHRGAALEVGLPNVMGPDAPLIRSMMSALAEQVYALGGLGAFDCPKPSAVVHEAGHCVMYASEGLMPTRAAIWPITRLGRTQWVGKTYGTPPWQVDDRTTAEADLSQARCLMAGVVAESLFDPDYRLGSSLDEWAIGSGIVQTAASKMNRQPEQLLASVLDDVACRLKLYEKQVFEIANELMQKHVIRGGHLRSLLAPIMEHRNAGRSE